MNNPQFVNTRLMHFLHLSFNVMLFRHMISKQSTFKLQNLFYHNQTAYCTVISAFIIFFSRYANVILAIWQKWIFNFQVSAFRQKMHKISHIWYRFDISNCKEYGKLRFQHNQMSPIIDTSDTIISTQIPIWWFTAFRLCIII